MPAPTEPPRRSFPGEPSRGRLRPALAAMARRIGAQNLLALIADSRAALRRLAIAIETAQRNDPLPVRRSFVASERR